MLTVVRTIASWSLRSQRQGQTLWKGLWWMKWVLWEPQGGSLNTSLISLAVKHRHYNRNLRGAGCLAGMLMVSLSPGCRSTPPCSLSMLLQLWLILQSLQHFHSEALKEALTVFHQYGQYIGYFSVAKSWSMSGKAGNRSLKNNLQLITYLIFFLSFFFFSPHLLFWQIVLQTHKFAANNS